MQKPADDAAMRLWDMAFSLAAAGESQHAPSGMERQRPGVQADDEAIRQSWDAAFGIVSEPVDKS